MKGRCPRPLDDGDFKTQKLFIKTAFHALPTKPEELVNRAKSGGGGKRDRTADLLHAMQALSQLSYTPTGSSSRCCCASKRCELYPWSVRASRVCVENFAGFLPESQIKRGKAFFYQDLSGLISNIARDRNKPPTRPITLGDTHHVAMAIKNPPACADGFFDLASPRGFEPRLSP